MTKRRIHIDRTVAAIAIDDLRVQVVVAAGILRADQAVNEGGWRKCPAQCPIFITAATGGTTAEWLALLDAWLAAYHARLNQHASARMIANGMEDFPSIAAT